jgi:hypothetical protein
MLGLIVLTVKPVPVGITIAVPVIVTCPFSIEEELPVTSYPDTGTISSTVPVAVTPVGITIAFPVIPSSPINVVTETPVTGTSVNKPASASPIAVTVEIPVNSTKPFPSIATSPVTEFINKLAAIS